ncbi:hypothetical protein [Sorangium sp. So ce406]|uniref:hypothetical protein n=1 Tax=Sorangium sp. So ce406 TaxID=3133311 RepID=UPI003F5C4DC1
MSADIEPSALFKAESRISVSLYSSSTGSTVQASKQQATEAEKQPSKLAIRMKFLRDWTDPAAGFTEDGQVNHGKDL